MEWNGLFPEALRMSTLLCSLCSLDEKKRTYGTHRNSSTNITSMASTFMHPKSPLRPLQENFQPIFSYFGKVFGTRTWAVMSWLRNASCLLTEFILLLGDSRPGLFLTGPGSKMACGLWIWYTVMSMNTQAFNTYLFWGSGSHRPKRETHVKRVCALFLTHTHTPTHTQAPTGSGSERPSQVNPPHMEAGWTRTAENPCRIKSDFSNPTMIHSCNWTSCKNKPEHFSRLRAERSVFCSRQTAGGRVCRCRAELFRLGCLIPLMFFFSILSPHPGVTCSDLHSPRLPTKDIKHMHTSTLSHTRILMLTHSWFIANICEPTRIIQSAPLQHFKVNSSQWNRYSRRDCVFGSSTLTASLARSITEYLTFIVL